MEKVAELGPNRTGTQLKPEETERQLDAVDKYPPNIPGDASALAEARKAAHTEADPLGSVPVPGSAKGKLKAGMDKMIGKQPELLVDKLGERLAFERTGVRMYEAMLAKLEASESPSSKAISALQRIRDEEAEHMDLVKRAIETLGADPTAMTPCANVAGVKAMGIVKVMSDPHTNVAQALNALLTIELEDNAAWEMLIDLTHKAGHPNISNDFKHALKQENDHLETIQSMLKNEMEAHM